MEPKPKPSILGKGTRRLGTRPTARPPLQARAIGNIARTTTPISTTLAGCQRLAIDPREKQRQLVIAQLQAQVEEESLPQTVIEQVLLTVYSEKELVTESGIQVTNSNLEGRFIGNS